MSIKTNLTEFASSIVNLTPSPNCVCVCVWGGDRGAGARENRGREGYGRRERKGREAGEKYETLIFLIQQCVRILSKTRTQNIRANYNAGLD